MVCGTDPRPSVTDGWTGRGRRRRRNAGRNWKRRGAAVVEFALVSPILCLLLIGLFEFGRVLMVQQVLTNASREAAREASLLSTNNGLVEDAAMDLTDSASLENVTVTINPALNTLDPGDSVTVTVRVPLQAVSWISGSWFPSGYQLAAASVARKEGFE